MSEKSTRAQVPPPRKPFLPESLEPVRAANNMQADRIVPMTFNMPVDWHTRFKMTAVANQMNMKELLIAAFEAWERENKDKAR